MNYNFSNIIQSRNNPDFFKWRVINTSLDRSENISEDHIPTYKSILKVIGLLDLFHGNHATINKDFLLNYFEEIIGVESIERQLNELEERGLIKYHRFRGSYSIYEGSDIDIEQEIVKKKTLGKITSI